MNIKDFFKLRPNAAADKNTAIVERAAVAIRELTLTTERLARNDIASWRAAHQMAVSVDNPRRLSLYNIYDFTTMLDAHLSGVILRTRTGIMQRKFRMVDRRGKENPELTRLLQAPWFYSFMSIALDAQYYGHSLIQIGNVAAMAGRPYYTDMELVPRRHVVPEFSVLLRRQDDDPATGISWLKPPLANWCMEVGDRTGLGLLLKVTPHVISKKHAQIFWDNFAERFGIPVIYATSEARNDADRVKIENMLGRMGNSTWGFFPAGTELKLIETAKGDAFQVFDQRIIRANREISIGLSGQTMAFEDGASLSQAEVHEKGFMEVKDSMARSLAFTINWVLIPAMIRHGFPVAGYAFDWDDSREYTPEEMNRIEETVLRYYQVDPAYFSERYNIPVTGERESLPATGDQGGAHGFFA